MVVCNDMNNLILLLTLVFILGSCNKSKCHETNCNGPVTYEYAPVCGCNNITYPNPSTAECHGITDYYQGECDNK